MTVERALEELYRERFGQFVAMAGTLVRGNSAAAQDVVQEAFARAYAGRKGFRGDGPLAGWVWRIVLNRVSQLHGEATFAEWLDGAGGETVGLATPDADPDVTAALRELTARQRAIVFLRFYADLSYEEIATALGVQPGTVAATLNQSIAILRRRLQPDEVKA